MNTTKTKYVLFAALAAAALSAGAWLLISGTWSAWSADKQAAAKSAPKFPPPALVEVNGHFGLELSADAIESLELKPAAALAATQDIALPPMIGAVNYDMDRLFSIKPLFTGQLAELKQVEETRETLKNGSTAFEIHPRPLKWGDRFKQGDVLAIYWSKELGEKKAALVDAICGLRLSQETLQRQRGLYEEGALSLAAFKQTERQVQIDSGIAMTAERTLRMWKLGDTEIKAIKDEANVIHDQKLARDIVKEVNKWARVEIKVPWFDPAHPQREMTVIEKNTNLGETVDPTNFSVPLFKIADLSRLQVWVHPPEEYLPLVRKQMAVGPGALKWKIRFHAEGAKMPPLDLAVEQISHGLDPVQHTPMLIGYLDNPEHKYLIGQFVTATIFIRPPDDTVEVPTDAVNPLAGQDFVFIENPEVKNQFLIRRVSVAQSLKKTSYVRSVLTSEQERANRELKEGEYPIQRLNAGDRVVTRGVVELTAALEELRSAKKPGKD